MKKHFLIILVALLWCNVGFADYYVTGKIQGGNKKLLGFATQIVSVDAVGKPGDLYSLQMRYKKVSEYDKKKGRCWIYTELSQVGKVLNFFKNQSFYQRKSDGSYKKLNLEYITFPCVKR